MLSKKAQLEKTHIVALGTWYTLPIKLPDTVTLQKRLGEEENSIKY